MRKKESKFVQHESTLIEPLDGRINVSIVKGTVFLVKFDDIKAYSYVKD